ncbi:type II toxin-antitoxin system VapC family toxin [Jiella sp. M17.18]|uniref:type II toxin-antitoxin system VapC family toxin n=1 Tax=Jiella sp. M17.18 TaxID=3234247 RepID=UPI0034DF2BF0
MVGYLLDTVTVSALRRPERHGADFQDFARSISLDDAFLSSVTIAEIYAGITQQQARDPGFAAVLSEWVADLKDAFDGRILAFGRIEAEICGALPTPQKTITQDSMIAATALAHGLTVLTRNRRDFESLGAAVIDPWNGPVEEVSSRGP